MAPQQQSELANRREALLSEVHRLEEELRQREEQLPAHSVQPYQLLAIEELEEEIARKKKELEALGNNLSRSHNADAS
ncbi:MAG: hypothetical protein JRH07_08180 [Deltaproteobacteria bacterium]|nr:hypothetical protein [Deltaproteobacteria bacterium]MBW2121807.1 hypothetical protein [Deltaproteobacteria bacterium]